MSIIKGYSSVLKVIGKSQNNIILYGFVGSGKTTLFNKICQYENKSEIINNNYSTTKEIKVSSTSKYNYNNIIDFPGLNELPTDIISYLTKQKYYLINIPIRMICLVIKCTPRYDDMIKQLSQMIAIFRDYIKNICVIITNTEKSKDKDKSEIELILRRKFGIYRIIFSSLESDGIELCEKIEKFKNEMEFIGKIIIRESNLTQIIYPEFNYDFIEEREKYIEKFKKALSIYNNEFQNTNDKELKRALYFSLRDYKDKLIKEYSELIKTQKVDLDYIITEIIMFNNEIFYDFNKFKRSVEGYLNTEEINFNGQQIRYKKCPHCGLIWCLVYGSPNTVCGKRTTIKDKIYHKYRKYNILFENGTLNISYIDIEPKKEQYINTEKTFVGLSERENEINKNRKKDIVEIKPIGCGEKLNWYEMEDVTDIVVRQLKIIDDNYIASVSDIIMNNFHLLIDNEKYEEALIISFLEQDNRHYVLSNIQKKKPELMDEYKELYK